MGGVPCTCGHHIEDRTDNIPYKARFWMDRHHEAFAEELVEGFVALARDYADGSLFETPEGARSRGRQGEEAALRSRVRRLVYLTLMRWSAGLLQCERCGRLWLHRPYPPRGFVGFRPEGAWHRALDVVPHGGDPRAELLLRVLQEAKEPFFQGRPSLNVYPRGLSEVIEAIRRGDPGALEDVHRALDATEAVPMRDEESGAKLRSLLDEARALASELLGDAPQPAP